VAPLVAVLSGCDIVQPDVLAVLDAEGAAPTVANLAGSADALSRSCRIPAATGAC